MANRAVDDGRLGRASDGRERGKKASKVLARRKWQRSRRGRRKRGGKVKVLFPIPGQKRPLTRKRPLRASRRCLSTALWVLQTNRRDKIHVSQRQNKGEGRGKQGKGEERKGKGERGVSVASAIGAADAPSLPFPPSALRPAGLSSAARPLTRTSSSFSVVAAFTTCSLEA